MDTRVMLTRAGVHFPQEPLYCRMSALLQATHKTGRQRARGFLMRATVLVTAVCFSLAGLASADEAQAVVKRATDIPAQPLAPALQALVKDRDIQLVYRSELVGDRRTAGASGELTAVEALGQLLSGTGLTYRYLDDKTITILPIPSGTASATDVVTSPQAGAGTKTDVSAAAQEATPTAAREVQKKSFWDRFRLAQTDSERPAGDRPTVAPDGEDSTSPTAKVEEVVVTAQKRKERLLDVPMSVGVVSASSLADSNQTRIQDFYAKLPGVSIGANPNGPQTFLIIRGIATGGASSVNPTVSVMIDDVPYGSATGLGGGGFGAPDLDPGDLERIEVLRGPQGTLYGAASIGGLMKFVTVDPSTDSFSGRVQGGVSGISDADEAGYSFRGSVNVPLSDNFAIRASGFTRRDPGYLTDPALGLEEQNRTDVDGGRLAALWQVSDDFSLKFSALVQQSEIDGSPYSNSGLEQSFAVRGQRSESETEAYSVTASAQFGNAELTAISGYSTYNNFNIADYTPVITATQNQTQFGLTGSGSTYLVDDQAKKFSQEIRLAAPLGEHFDSLVGLFYTHEDSPRFNSIQAVQPPTGATLAKWIDFHLPSDFTQYAVFANLTVKITDRFDVQTGVRSSWDELDASTTYVGPYTTVFLGAPSPLVSPEIQTHSDKLTYQLSPRFKITPDLMVYARLATGYRPGGPNTSATALGIPKTFSPDNATNYEIGLKGDFLDRRLSVETAAYYIDWQDLQIRLRDPVIRIAYYANAGAAKSQGIELSLTARPLEGLAIGGWASWNDAVIEEAFPGTSPTYGAPGDRLPFSSRFTASVSADYEFPIAGTSTVFVGASASYVGDRVGLFQGRNASGGPLPRQEYPAYVRSDFHAGLKHDAWTLNLFVNNLANERAALDGGIGNVFPNLFVYTQPRTYGMSLARTF